MSFYGKLIGAVLEAAEVPFEFREVVFVEAWMRTEFGTLDSLSTARFREEVLLAVDCMRSTDEATNESLARSWGLRGWERPAAGIEVRS